MNPVIFSKNLERVASLHQGDVVSEEEVNEVFQDAGLYECPESAKLVKGAILHIAKKEENKFGLIVLLAKVYKQVSAYSVSLRPSIFMRNIPRYDLEEDFFTGTSMALKKPEGGDLTGLTIHTDHTGL